MQAARDIESSMEAVTIPRIVAGYHDDAVEENTIASATGIRKSFFELDALDSVSNFFPDATYTGLKSGKRKINPLVTGHLSTRFFVSQSSARARTAWPK